VSPRYANGTTCPKSSLRHGGNRPLTRSNGKVCKTVDAHGGAVSESCARTQVSRTGAHRARRWPALRQQQRHPHTGGDIALVCRHMCSVITCLGAHWFPYGSRVGADLFVYNAICAAGTGCFAVWAGATVCRKTEAIARQSIRNSLVANQLIQKNRKVRIV